MGNTVYRTGGSFIEKTYKGHSPEPPTLVVKWMETLSRDVTWLRSDAFLKNHRSPDNLKRNCSKFLKRPSCQHPSLLARQPSPHCQRAPAQGATAWRSRLILDHAGNRAHPPSAPRHACNALLSASCPSNSRSTSRRRARRPGVRVRRAHALCAMLTLRRGDACAGVYLDSARSRCVQTRRWLPCMCL